MSRVETVTKTHVFVNKDSYGRQRICKKTYPYRYWTACGRSLDSRDTPMNNAVRCKDCIRHWKNHNKKPVWIEALTVSVTIETEVEE